MPRPLAAAAAALAVCTLGGVAGAQVIYTQNFEAGSAWPEWSVNQTTQSPTFTRFLGRFLGERATLGVELPPLPEGDGIAGPPEAASYLLEFSFYCIDSWDGSDANNGPDRFHVFINNEPIFSETFANQHQEQSYREPDVGRSHMGFHDSWFDSIYHIALPFVAPAGNVNIGFQATGLLTMSDESWGIDNVRVSVIPAPGVAGVALVGLGAFGGRKRRRER